MNHRATARLMVIVLLSAASLAAQDSTDSIYDAKRFYMEISDNIIKSAEEMPAKYYGFQPSHDSPSFADLLGDAASSQSDFCSAIQGERTEIEGPLSREKGTLIAILTRSVRTCAAAYASVNSFNAGQRVMFGGVAHSRLILLFLNISYDNEVYGKLSVYLRMKDLVPPSEKARVVPVNVK